MARRSPFISREYLLDSDHYRLQASSDKEDLPAAKETDMGGTTTSVDSDSGCVLQ